MSWSLVSDGHDYTVRVEAGLDYKHVVVLLFVNEEYLDPSHCPGTELEPFLGCHG